jgi:hypothetical protein
MEPLDLGRNALSGERIRIPFADCCRHWDIRGRTGMGKTRADFAFGRYLIDSQHALVVLDGKGDLFEMFRDYCAVGVDPERVVIVDPTDDRWAVGVNYLELIGDTDPAVLSELVMEGLKKAFHEADEFKPLLEEWSPAALLPLIKAGLTLAELEEFASIAHPQLRQAVFAQPGADLEREARKWGELKAYGPHEAAVMTRVVRTRAALLTQSPMAQAMFGQTKTTINWRKVLDEGGVVLIRAHPHEKITQRLRTLLGATILHQVMLAARSRPREDRRDAFLMADEFQQFACEDFKEALTQMRSFKLWFILSSQELHHLDEQVPGLSSTLLAECTGKLYFSVSREDADRAVFELFQGDLHGDQVKHEIYQTKFRPVETTRVVESQSHSDGLSESTSDMDVVASGHVSASSSGFDESYGPGWVALPFPWERTGSAWSQRQSDAHSASASTGHGHAAGTTSVDSTARSVVPWYEYREFQELSARSFYPLEEVVHRAITWLMCQDPRKAMLKIANRKTLPVIVREVPDVPVLPEEVEALLQEVMPRCARPLEEVRKEIWARVQAFLQAHGEMLRAAEAAAAGPPPVAGAGLLPPPEPIVDPIGDHLCQPKQPERTR